MKIFRAISFILISGTLLFSANIVHDRIENIVVNEPIRFQLELDQVEIASVDFVRLYYKGDMDNDFSYEELNYIPPNQFVLETTPLLNDAVEFSYYFTVRLADGTELTEPEFFPRENAYVASVMRSANDPKILLLNPENKSVIADAQPVMLVSYEDAFDILDLDSVTIKFDGRDVTKKSMIYRTFASYMPDKLLKLGAHVLEFTVKDMNGQEYKVKSAFRYQPKKETLFDYKGSNETFLDAYSTNKSSTSRPGSKFKNKLSVKLSSALVDVDIYEYMTSEDSPDSQKQNRSKLKVYDKKKRIVVDLKDSSPVLSEYTMNGINVEGLNARWKLWPGLFEMSYVQGNTKRAIDGTSYATSNVAYEQNVLGFQVKTGAFRFLNPFTYLYYFLFGNDLDENIGFTYTKFQDDRSSILLNRGVNPKENVVMALHGQSQMFRKAMKMKWEFAGSYYNSNFTTDNIISFGDVEIPTIVTDLFPIRSNIAEVPVGFASKFELSTPLIFKELYLKTYGSLVTNEFNSLGNSSVKKDDLAYGSSVKLSLLRNAVSFTGSFKKSMDQTNKIPVIKSVIDLFKEAINLSTSGNETDTTENDDMRFMSNINFFGMANLGANYGLAKKYNGATTGNIVNNQTQAMNFSLSNIKLNVDRFKGKLAANYGITRYDDQITSGQNFQQSNIRIAVDTELKPVKLKITLSNSNKDHQTITPSMTTYTSLATRIDYEYIPKILNTYASIAIQKGLNEGDDASKQIDNNKTSLQLGCIYKLAQKYGIFFDSKLYLDLLIAAATDNKDTSDQTKNFTETTFTFKFKTFF